MILINKLTAIGNLTRDPELRTTQSGLSVCSFTIAVNRRRQQQDGQPEADFFRVSAWRQLGENCAKYLAKGRKVCVVGPVSVSTYTGQDGTTRASLEVTAEDVEFLTSRAEAASSGGGDVVDYVPKSGANASKPIPRGAQYVDPDGELPF